jgi:zinc protease
VTALNRSSAPPPAPVRPFRFPVVERSQLKNGLAMLVAPHGNLPIVTAQLVLAGGASAEPGKRGGLAHLTANLLETGTEKQSADRVAWALERLGVQFESEASWDATVLRIVVARERLDPAMEVFADLARRPSFPGTEFDRIRDEHLATLSQRKKEPRALANDMVPRFVYPPGVPYARPLMGTPGSVTTISRADVLGFYGVNYRPGGASLVFVGDIDAETAQRLAEDRFGDWATGSSASPGFEVAPALDRTAVFIVHRPESVQSEIRIADVGVSRHHPDYFPLLVMNNILGGAFTSRLNMSLREKHGFTYGVRSNFSFRRKPGPFTIQSAVATEVTARAVEETLREVHLLRDSGANPDEVSASRDFLAGVLPLELQTTEQLAARLADLVVYGLPDDYFEHYPESILAVTAEDVQRVAREHLRPDRFAVVIVGDAEKISPDLEALGIGNVHVQQVDE